MKVFFYTLGCKVNQYETECLREIFLSSGYTPTSNEKEADVFVINSCTVTEEASRKSKQILRRFKRLNKNGITVLCGCFPQAFPSDSEKIEEADIVTGNKSLTLIPSLADEFIKSGKKIRNIVSHERDEKYSTPLISDFSERTRAYIKIEDGCENYCTYCIIPTSRGVVRSKSLSDIKKEASAIAEKGFCEIVLVGINLTSYGKDSEFDLADAVFAVAENEKIKRVRLGSVEPDKMTDEILEKLSKEPKFCPQFHLSLQSGSSKTLACMNRHYDADFYRNLILKIRNTFDNPSITTDIMVGFAGETEEEFNESIDFAKEIGFAKAHIFAYSKRKGTVADKLPNQISSEEKQKRSRQMIEVTNKTEKDFLLSQIGKTAYVLFENTENNFTYGYTENYTRVKVKADNSLHGKIKQVKIISAESDTVEAEIL